MLADHIPNLLTYLQAHPELGLRWVPADSPRRNSGCWEIVYITGHIPFDPGALASPSLEGLEARVPRPDGSLARYQAFVKEPAAAGEEGD